MSIRNQDVIEWSSFRGKLGGKIRVGFMSQVSPDGPYVVTMIKGRMPAGVSQWRVRVRRRREQKTRQGPGWQLLRGEFQGLPVPSGFLSDARDSGLVQPGDRPAQPLPGADDPRYVHTNAAWSPDGKYLVFARAEAQATPYPEGTQLAEYANDPNETQIHTTSTGFLSTTGKAAGRNRWPGHPEMA